MKIIKKLTNFIYVITHKEEIRAKKIKEEKRKLKSMKEETDNRRLNRIYKQSWEQLLNDINNNTI